VIAEPPFETGAVKVMVASPFPRTAETSVGAPGPTWKLKFGYVEASAIFHNGVTKSQSENAACCFISTVVLPVIPAGSTPLPTPSPAAYPEVSVSQ
jgi:hypothetical protein